jgi:hypothetical protein
MKIEVKRTKTTIFQPVTLTITIQTQEELDAVINVCDGGSEMIERIVNGRHQDDAYDFLVNIHNGLIEVAP